jgi:hypothetical protein
VLVNRKAEAEAAAAAAAAEAAAADDENDEVVDLDASKSENDDEDLMGSPMDDGDGVDAAPKKKPRRPGNATPRIELRQYETSWLDFVVQVYSDRNLFTQVPELDRGRMKDCLMVRFEVP